MAITWKLSCEIGDAFKVGDHVRVVRKKGETRVEPIPATEPPKEPPKP